MSAPWETELRGCPTEIHRRSGSWLAANIRNSKRFLDGLTRGVDHRCLAYRLNPQQKSFWKPHSTATIARCAAIQALCFAGSMSVMCRAPLSGSADLFQHSEFSNVHRAQCTVSEERA
jgi:hypothetical protein